MLQFLSVFTLLKDSSDKKYLIAVIREKKKNSLVSNPTITAHFRNLHSRFFHHVKKAFPPKLIQNKKEEGD